MPFGCLGLFSLDRLMCHQLQIAGTGIATEVALTFSSPVCSFHPLSHSLDSLSSVAKKAKAR